MGGGGSNGQARRGEALLAVLVTCATCAVFAACGTDEAYDEQRVRFGRDSGAASDGTRDDAGVDTPLPPCVSSFVPESTCEHPAVVASCTAGWCRIPRGCFKVGSPECEFGRGLYNENENQVTLTHDFEIRQTEVTQGEWTALGITNPSTTAATVGDCQSADCPVGNVSWFDALAFANRLSSAHTPPLSECYRLLECTGVLGQGLACKSAEQTTASTFDCEGYRLPSEAEWEYAARAGTSTSFYLGQIQQRQGDINACTEEPHLETAAWYCFNAGKRTHPAAQRVANGWGLFDMLGNAHEWVADEYSSGGYGKVARMDPGAVLGNDPTRVRRGGVITGSANVCTVTKRFPTNRTLRGPTVGFRLVRTLGAGDGGAPDGGL